VNPWRIPTSETANVREKNEIQRGRTSTHCRGLRIKGRRSVYYSPYNHDMSEETPISIEIEEYGWEVVHGMWPVPLNFQIQGQQVIIIEEGYKGETG
jgi:hypothetical protein